MLRLLLGEITQAVDYFFCLASVYCIQNLKNNISGTFLVGHKHLRNFLIFEIKCRMKVTFTI